MSRMIDFCHSPSLYPEPLCPFFMMMMLLREGEEYQEKSLNRYTKYKN